MAAARKEVIRSTIIYCFLCLLISPGHGVRTKKKIYIDLKTQSACFRNLDATRQVGCQSAMKGNVGTVHYIETEDDFDWILSKGPHSPYVALMNPIDFNGTSVRRLYRSSRVNGIMVINTLNDTTVDPYPPDGFSSDETCPNKNFGLYSNNSDYDKCQKMMWNPPGSALHLQDIGMPVFALSDPDDVDAVLNKCFYRFNQRKNNQSRSYPVCAAELKSRMDAAVDAITCLRRTNRIVVSLSGEVAYCDNLGDMNVVATMMDTPQNETRMEGSVILVGAKMDATSLFQNEYYAADTAAAGIVAMLVAAEALWKVKHEIVATPDAKDIMFAFFQGETFDYIGSSRMVYDMTQDKFPQDYKVDKKSLHLHQINLTHLDQIVELNQVAHRDDEGSLWAHTDPLSRSAVSKKITKMIQDLNTVGDELDVNVKELDETLPLPPASSQSFLKGRSDVPVVVITDHKGPYTNKYYNSRFDTASQIKAEDYPQGLNETEKYDYVTPQAELIANLSSTLARYLYVAATGNNLTDEIKENLTANPLTATHLLYCMLISPNCELFAQSVSSDNVKSLETAKQPFPFYVSVDQHTNEITTLVYAILAQFAGERMDLEKDKCKQPSEDKRYSYQWMQGAKTVNEDGEEKREGWCIKSTALQTKAVSPAFVIDGYDMRSGQYSTWTESRWGNDAIGVRLFLLPSQQFQLLNLCTGIAFLLLSLVLVYFISTSADVIFQSSTEAQLPAVPSPSS